MRILEASSARDFNLMVIQLDLTFVDGVRNRRVGWVSASKERYAAPVTERAIEDSRSWFQRALPPAETTKHYSAFQRIKDGRNCAGTAERFKTTEPVSWKEHDTRGPYTKHLFLKCWNERYARGVGSADFNGAQKHISRRSMSLWVTMMSARMRGPGSSPVRTERPWWTLRSSGLARRDPL